MKRQIAGLNAVSRDQLSISDGAYLVRVEGAKYRWESKKPFLDLSLAVLKPLTPVTVNIVGRIYCTPKALWKLNQFLREFEYDPDLFNRNEIDEKCIVGLVGIVRTCRRIVGGRSFLNLEDFANKSEWNESDTDFPNGADESRTRL
jgi:hypothetical protein